MANEIKLESTTNTQEEVVAAMGGTPAVTPAETPAPKAGKKAATPPPPPAPETPAEPPPAPEDEPTEDEDETGDEDGETSDADASEAGRTLASRRKHQANHRIRALLKEKQDVQTSLTAAQQRALELEQEVQRLKTPPPAPPAPSDGEEKTKPAAAAPPVQEERPPYAADIPFFAKPEPNENDFDTYNEYLEAKFDWKLEKRDYEHAVQQEIARREYQMMSQAEQAQSALKQRFDKARTKYTDFDEVLAAAKDLQISVAVRDHLRFSEVGAELAYYLSTNPDEAERVSTMAPGKALVELGKLEAKLEAGTLGAAVDEPPTAPATPIAEPAVPVRKVPVSKAPPPMTRPGGSTTSSTKPLDQEDYQVFKERRNAQIRARSGR